MIHIPIIGQVSAGTPFDFIPIERWRWIRPLQFTSPGEQVYGMEVVGDSLKDKNILDGDILVFVHGQPSRPSDLCIVQTPHGLTAKYVYPREDGEVLLASANALIRDQVWSMSDVKIIGVVKRVERDL
jgi:repressor LexA